MFWFGRRAMLPSTRLSSPRKRGPIVPNAQASGIWVPAVAGTTPGLDPSESSTPSSVHHLFRRALARQRRRRLIVALLARQHRLQADQLVIVVERDEMVLAGRERVAALERAQHVAHRLRRREQCERREGGRADAGRYELPVAAS